MTSDTTNKQVITGNETIANRGSAKAALVHFYKAFNQRDLKLMADNWVHTPDATMSNPLGGITRGWEEIKAVYEAIFFGPARVYVEYYDYQIFESGDFFQAVGRERGTFEKGGHTLNLQIRTSRSFVATEGRYMQIHHHGSIENPKLLAAYQSAVLNRRNEE